MDFELSIPGFLYAIGDPERIEVYRSIRVRYTDKMYWPVSEYVWSHGLVLNATEVERDTTMMGYSAEYSIYTRPGAPPESTEGMSFYMGALQCGITFEEFFAEMVNQGVVLEHPEGGYFPSPHPSLVDRYPNGSGMLHPE